MEWPRPILCFDNLWHSEYPLVSSYGDQRHSEIHPFWQGTLPHLFPAASLFAWWGVAWFWLNRIHQPKHPKLGSLWILRGYKRPCHQLESVVVVTLHPENTKLRSRLTITAFSLRQDFSVTHLSVSKPSTKPISFHSNLRISVVNWKSTSVASQCYCWENEIQKFGKPKHKAHWVSNLHWCHWCIIFLQESIAGT